MRLLFKISILILTISVLLIVFDMLPLGDISILKIDEVAYGESNSNLVCGPGSSGACPTTGTECPGPSTCNFPTCECVVTSSQTIDSGATYNLKFLIINSGVNVNVATDAPGGSGGWTPGAGSNGSGTGGGSGGRGGNTPGYSKYCPVGASGGSNAGGGGGGAAYVYRGCGAPGGSFSGGGGGGKSGQGAGGAGGGGGGLININATESITISGNLNANGATGANGGYGGGGSSSRAGGGGGGGGGGNITLDASTVNISGALNTRGGRGGNGGDANPGSTWSYGGSGAGGGGGGKIVLIYSLYNLTGTISVSGGPGGVWGSGSDRNGVSGAAGGTGIIEEYRKPQVETQAATGTTPSQATLNGNITDTGDDLTCSERGFDWGTIQGGPYPDSWSELGSFGIGSFNRTITGLSPGTTYYFRAKAQNSFGWGYGSELSFTTPDFTISANPAIIKAPQTGASQASTITITSLNGFNSAVNLSVTSGLPTGATPNFNPNPVTPPPNGTTTSDFTVDTSNVIAGSYNLTIQGQSGAIIHTETMALEVVDLSVTLEAIPSSGEAPLNGVDLTATVSGSAIGTINYKFDCTNDGTWELQVDNSTLNPYTAVDLCDYATAGTYTAKVFVERDVANPAEDTATVMVTWTPPTVSTSAATGVTSSQATLNGSIDDTGGENADQRGFDWDTDSGEPYANSWTEIDSFGTGAFSYPITGLDPDTTYYFRAKAQNSAGWGYGSELSFTTPDFTISANPAIIKAPQTGASQASTITITSLNGFNFPVNLSVASGLPTGATANFSPNPVTPPANGTTTSDFTVDTSNVIAGSYNLTIQGQSGALTHTTALTLEVVDLSVNLTAGPSSGTAPLNDVDLTATVSGSAIGTINYKFDCTDDGTWELEVNNSLINPYTAVDLCNYSLAGTYTAKVFVERDVANPAEDTAIVTVITRSASLTSSPYDTTMAANILSQIQWTEDLPSGTDIKFQLRTSPDNSSWTNWMGPDGSGTSYFQSANSTYCSKVGSTVTCTIPSGIAIGDGLNDQWIQYKVWLTSDSIQTPTLFDVTLTYGI